MAKEIRSMAVAEEAIISKIYLVRGQKVMLDRDLAELYGVETKVLKQAVRRNMSRFPADFMFEMATQRAPRLEVTICDFQRRQAGLAVRSLLFYRTGRNDVILHLEQ